jgi:hypothetical protein
MLRRGDFSATLRGENQGFMTKALQFCEIRGRDAVETVSHWQGAPGLSSCTTPSALIPAVPDPRRCHATVTQ